MAKRKTSVVIITEPEEKEKKNNRSLIGTWGIIGTLVLLVLLGNMFGTKHLNARYTGKILGTSSAQVAAVGGSIVKGSFDPSTLKITDDWNVCYTFDIKNVEAGGGKASQVSLDYNMDVVIEAPIGLVFKIVPMEAGIVKDAVTNLCASSDTMEVVDTKRKISVSSGLFLADGNVQTHSYAVLVKWNDKRAEYANVPCTIQVYVDVVQRD